MRKLANKKGFSLVELMIVVVIMGILIAVAVPLYGAVTDSSRAKTCKNNQKVIKEAFSQWVLGGDDNERNSTTLFVSGSSFNGSTMNEADVFPPEFLNLFDGETLPHCPDDDHYFIIESDSNGIQIKCMNPNGSDCTEHRL